MTYFITFIVAACSIIYELLMAQTLSALMGNTVLRYSVTIGLYLASLGLGAWMCDVKGHTRPPLSRLIRIELALSLIGGLCVIFLNCADMLEKFVFLHATQFRGLLEDILFLLLSHSIIIAIGILSGYEIPLLIALREGEVPHSTNRVLGMDYFGSLVGAVGFPLWLLPMLGVFGTAFAVAAFNALACLLLCLAYQPRQTGAAALAGLILFGLLAGLAAEQRVAQFFLRHFYYYPQHTGPTAVFSLLSNTPPVERHRSRYQEIHLVPKSPPYSFVPALMKHSRKQGQARDYPFSYTLFLDGRYQWSSDIEEYYHEFFAHVPVQIAAQVPRKILILGGGDGLLARELLKYGQVESITLVELDAEMIRLGRRHAVIKRMNGGSLDDQRLRVIIGDAFTYLRKSPGRFDAIYADFPLPVNFDLARLYSREFYVMARQHLRPGGFAVMDVSFSEERPEWSTVLASMKTAGWRHITPFQARLGTILLEHFVMLSDRPTGKVVWQDHDIELFTLDAGALSAALAYLKADIDHLNVAANSIYRPQLPERTLVGLGFPW